jgi:hypothetical protein
LHKERKPLLTALFLLGALIFLRFVVFPPNALGYGKTPSLPTPKTFNFEKTALFMGSFPVAFSDESTTTQFEARNLAFLLGGKSTLIASEPSL